MTLHRSALLLALLAGVARAESQPPSPSLPAALTLDDALQIFRQRGLDLLIAEAAVQSAEGDLRVAGAIPNPNWSGGYYRMLFNNNIFESPNGWFLGLGDSNAIEDSLSGKRGLRLKVARAALLAARQSRADAQRTLEFQLKQAYLQAVLARDNLDFALEVQKGATQTYNLMHLRYQAGAISEADEAKVETAKLESDQAVDTVAQALRVAKLGVAFLLGVRGPVPDFHVDQDLPKFHVPEKLLDASRESLLSDAFEHRPDLKANAAQRDRAAASIRLARRLRFPDLGFALQYAQQGTSSGTCLNGGSPPDCGDTGSSFRSPVSPPTVQLSLAGTLPLLYQQQGEIKKAEADYRTQSLQRSKLEAQVVSDLEVAWTNLVSSRKLVERMEGRLLDRAKRARDLVELQYRKGAASLLEFLDANRTWIANNGEYLQDLANYWTAVYQLEQAVGMDLR